MIISLLTSLNFWSAFCGLIGTIFIFFFGLPSQINQDGHGHLLLEQVDEKEIAKGKLYKKAGYFGLFLIFLSFLIQIINLINFS